MKRPDKPLPCRNSFFRLSSSSLDGNPVPLALTGSSIDHAVQLR